MPGIDFDRLRREIAMEQVPPLIGFQPRHRRGDQWYGGCPLDGSDGEGGCHFSVNVAKRRFYCHRCHQHGNPLELWAGFCKLPLYPAMIELCRQLGREVPWIKRW